MTTSEEQEQTEIISDAMPIAIPVLSPEEAQTANNKALAAPKTKEKETLKQGAIKIVKFLIYISLLAPIVLCVFLFRKQCRKLLLRVYSSAFSDFYTQLNSAEWM